MKPIESIEEWRNILRKAEKKHDEIKAKNVYIPIIEEVMEKGE